MKRKPPTRKTARRGMPPLSREAWIVAAFETLYAEGIESVRVERLAKKLSVTKGSFYWHFQNRADLHAALLDYWMKEMTQSVLDTAKNFQGTPRDRLVNTLTEVIGKERTQFDPAVRNWARTDARVQKVVAHIDRIRLSFLHGLFADLGYDEREAEIRSRLMYYYIMGECFVTVKEPMTKRLTTLERKALLMMQPLAGG